MLMHVSVVRMKMLYTRLRTCAKESVVQGLKKKGVVAKTQIVTREKRLVVFVASIFMYAGLIFYRGCGEERDNFVWDEA